MHHLADTGALSLLDQRKPSPASTDDVSLVHSREYIASVRDLALSGGGYISIDTVVSPGSYDAALLAAGASIEAASAVLDGSLSTALALVRPPGHHAGYDRAAGFCLFNNIAIAAARILDDFSAKRVAILDFDIHHGNGTQHTFYSDPRVLFVSFHCSPFYPGTGNASEIGSGPGLGFTVNVPLPASTPPETYLSLWNSVLDEKVRPYRPEIILVSVGFDLYKLDPVAGLNFEIDHFRDLGASIASLAADTCSGQVVSILEGGYDLEATPLCLDAYLEGLRVL